MRNVNRAFLWCVFLGALAHGPGRLHAEETKTPDKPKAGPSCKLVNEESPRGGRLDISGEGFGQAPVVRVGDKVARILERREDRISVQVAADSDGGKVTVQAGKRTAECGTLVIIGKDR